MVSLSKQKNKNVPPVEEKKQDQGKPKEPEKKAPDPMQELLKMVPPDLQPMAQQYLALPQRMSELEANQKRINTVLEQLLKGLEGLGGQPAVEGQPAGVGGGVGQFLPLILRIFGGGGGEDTWLKKMAQTSMVEGITFDRMIRRQVLKKMGGTLYQDFKKAIDKIGVPELFGEGKSE